jgi:PD-(D/E)XK nuclease superfamily protein
MSQYPFPSIINSSTLETFKACPRKFLYSSISEFKPRGESVHLIAGGAFAKGLEVARNAFFVEGLSSDQAIARGLQALLQKYGDFQCPPDSAKSPERVCGAFEYYFSAYPLGELDVPITFGENRRGIEFSFALPIGIENPSTGDPILISGRMDAICSFAGGTYIVDEKTTSSLGPTWSRKWDLRGQFIGYAWGCRESGIRVDGSLIRGVSILKTKYDTAQAIVRHADWQVDQWFEETCWYIKQMINHWKADFYPHNYGDSCEDYGGCGFKTVCMSQDPAPWLEQGFERKHWDPIAGVETKL